MATGELGSDAGAAEVTFADAAAGAAEGAEDTMPASPGALLEAGRLQEPLPGGPLAGAAGAAEGGEDTAPASPRALLEAGRLQADVAAEDSDAEDDAADAQDDAGAAGFGPEEPWASYPPRERELWERVRPRQLRREAAQVKALRLPTAGLARLMRLHPAIQGRSPEAMEVLSASTVLLLQALVRAALRGKGPGHRLQFEDVRQACLGAKELCFLHPLSHTLDASTFTTRSAAMDLDVDEGGNAVRRPKPAGPGQRVLGAAMFATAAAAAPSAGGEAACGAAAAQDAADATDAGCGDAAAGGGNVEPAGTGPQDSDSGGEKTPIPRQKVLKGEPAPRGQGAPGKKRRAPASAQKQKAPRKVPRQGGAAAGGIADFFRAGA